MMKFFKTLLMAALFSLGASYAHACGVDSVSAKTDTSITIAWDVNCNNFLKIEICWKNAANSGNECNASALAFYTTTGSYTIEGLQPQTPYKIKTHWRKPNSAWKAITTRIVTTNPTPISSDVALRYEKGSGQPYFVTFYWKNPPAPSPTNDWKLGLVWQAKVPFGWSGPFAVDLTNAPTFTPTGEYYWQLNNEFNNNRRYVAWIVKWSRTYDQNGHIVDHFDYVSNKVEWK